MVLNYYKYAYHTIPSYNADSIENNGIVAKYTINPYGSNAQRTYLYLGNTLNPKYVNMMETISKKYKK